VTPPGLKVSLKRSAACSARNRSSASVWATRCSGLAYGGTTYKLKFGHRGGNQPVKDLLTGRVEITAQNHGFCVAMDSLDPEQVELTHINLNDQSCEGMRHKKYPAFRYNTTRNMHRARTMPNICSTAFWT
jgi:hypothetical protein